jgi:hypothetical protein
MPTPPALPTNNEIKYLFRFRDLVAKTIDEHRAIINTYRSCWRGWWKRTNEKDRDDVWIPLKAGAETGEPIPIGLFDSGHNNRVYRAWVTEVIPPSQGSEEIVQVPRNPELVPSYYRQSPFSRA